MGFAAARFFLLAQIALVLPLLAREPITAPPVEQINRFTWSREGQQDADGFYYQPAGLCEDYPEETTTLEKIREDLQIAREAGAKLLRVGIGWDGIEEHRGEFNWRFWDDFVRLAPEYGITLIPYVCYTPKWAARAQEDFWRQPPRRAKAFGEFMAKIAARYRGRIRSWELWNEQDNKDYWLGDPEMYSQLFAEGAIAVRKVSPDAVIVLGGLARGRSKFLDALLKQQDCSEYVDVFNLHGYNETWNLTPAHHYPIFVRDFYNYVSRFAPKRDFWMAEFGYSDYRQSRERVSEWVGAAAEYEHTAGYQAVALLQHHFLMLAAGKLSLTAWFRIRDLAASEAVIGDSHNRHFGIVELNGEPKPAFHALKFYNKLMNSPVRAITDDIAVEAPENTQSEVHVFEKNNGAFVVSAWLHNPASADLEKSNVSEKISVRLPPKAAGKLTVYNEFGTPISTGASLENGILSDVTLERGRIFVAKIAPAQ